MPAGPYQGHVLITEYKGEHRVMIIDRNDGEVLWSYDGLEKPLEAIYWDENAYHGFRPSSWSLQDPFKRQDQGLALR